MSLDPIEAKLEEGLPSNVIDDDESNINQCVSSQNSRGTKRKWVSEEDATLVACIVDLHNVGIFNAVTGFKAGYLNELEKMLEKVLPNAMLNAKPNLESRIRTLKRDWSISHKEAAQFKHRSFPYYDQLTVIYAKDRATGKDAQTVADIIKEINVEDVATTNTHEERNDFYRCEADVSLDDMDLSGTQSQPARNQGIGWRIEDGKRVNIWNDSWLAYPGERKIKGQNINWRYTVVADLTDEDLSFTRDVLQEVGVLTLPTNENQEWIQGDKIHHEGMQDKVCDVARFIKAYIVELDHLESFTNYRFNTNKPNWEPPSEEQVKVNFDTSYQQLNCLAISCIIITYNMGLVMGACGCRINNIRDSTTAKAVACVQAVTFAEEMDFGDVVIEGDSLTVIKKLNN
ncbi:hypothetical protein CXB51_026338 [Gossypium anomalum]|uniref:RNase H type-1 domain-containing protein n=1 Tax=Gossypium anomalum TaxID=47600 RepID=A0A8J5Y454_9ROSI|nr:hypothetical protein CXB51_026338 [Gossypium anomalum]